MEKAKHTPGPWNIYFNSQDDLVIRKMFADGQESHVVARCHSGYANARLIAAAPELLEALETLAEHFEYYMGDNECRPLENARAAIAKATGK